MNGLLRATALIGQPVVTLTGESPLELKDVVFDKGTGRILGFTLRKKGFLGGPVREYLPWGSVHGLGPDAVMVVDETSFDQAAPEGTDGGGDVIGDRVLTEGGTDLGRVVEVVVSTGRRAEVVGFEITPVPGSRDAGGHNVFIPLPDTLAVSGENIIVPDSAVGFIRDDLSGFGSAVDDFRVALSAGKEQ